MTLKEFEQRMAPILLEAAKEGFTGKVTFDIVFGEGGIRKVSVVRSHDMTPMHAPKIMEHARNG